MTLFQGDNIVVAGGNFSINGPQTPIETIFRFFGDNYVPSATHDSNAAFNAPKCHPGTRTSLLAALSNWVEDTASAVDLTRLHGPAGTGKSAIARSLAESLHSNQSLAGSFFFFRKGSRHNTETALVTTLAYQIACNVPNTQTDIANAIAIDPSIFSRSLQKQFKALILEPLEHISNSLLRPMLFIIDEFDACVDTKARARILDVVFTALPRLHGHIKFLVVSRPEYDIQCSFDSAAANLGRHINTIELEGDRQAHDDVRLYLYDTFHRIKQSHPLRKHFSPNWPSEDAIERLVGKSSGHFIYPNTVINYIEDARSRPQERLDIILNLCTTSDSQNPYAALDSSFLNTLRSSRTPHALLIKILSIVILISQFNFHPSLDKTILQSTRFIRSILFLRSGEVELALLDLNSLVRFEGTIEFWHPSFSDFLLDSSRSKEFYADPALACTLIAKRCSSLLSSPGSLERLWLDRTLNNPMLQYHLLLSLCCKDAARDRDLQNAMMKYDFNFMPPHASASSQHFSVLSSSLRNYEQSYTFKRKVVKRLRHQFDKYFISELRRWVPLDSEIMAALRATICPVHVDWRTYREFACKNPSVFLNHGSCFLHYMHEQGFPHEEPILCDFFYSNSRAHEYYLGKGVR